jgi:acetolactate synthase I/II/III large subunit
MVSHQINERITPTISMAWYLTTKSDGIWERIALRRERPVENKGIGVQIKDPAPDLAAIARALSVAGFGPITEPDQLGPTLDQAIAVVQGGKPAVVDVITQPR